MDPPGDAMGPFNVSCRSLNSPSRTGLTTLVGRPLCHLQSKNRSYGLDRVIERDNDRLMSGIVNRRWEDIKPPPGEGYGIFPGADRSYTIGVKVMGSVIDEDFWIKDSNAGQVWPKGGPNVLRPENKQGRMPSPVVYETA